MSAKKDGSLPNRQPKPADAAAERRRFGKIVRDDRDAATVEWVDAPSDFERVPLSLEGTLPNAKRPGQGGYNPYGTDSPHQPMAGSAKDQRPAKRDLRKLSEWIKQMREIERRKKRGED
ncbi:MAG TPA: hypothetical protein VK696_08925 [Steroidobacteraceae bacterium]|nr:hypothetical protein [Steroidobacteraceae bacterium]